jgi:NADPH:quinone reductase-like Zn-dependent oxidoreductase
MFRRTYPTSYEALVGRAQTKAGEWVLVHAAAGGVGMAAVQIAKGTCFVIPSCKDDCLLMRSLLRLIQRLVVK